MAMTFVDVLSTVRSGRRTDGDRSGVARTTIGALAVMLVLAFLFSLASGASEASAWQVFQAATGLRGDTLAQTDRIIVFDIRLPRAVLGILIGASLAVSGALMQGLFRNPLADPGIVGVTAGASFGAVGFIVLGSTTLAPVSAVLGVYALPTGAFAGGLLVTLFLYRIATRRGQTSVATMLLAGIALAALVMAVTGLLIFHADDQQLRDLTFWNLGSLAGATWTRNLMAAPFILPAIALAFLISRQMNTLSLGEGAARHMGTDPQRTKMISIVCVAAASGASVAASGGIGFVGIVVPHLLRLLIGPDHRYLLPASALLGAILLLLADAVARQVVAPAELPIGIVTALAGAPFFLWILLRKRGILDL